METFSLNDTQHAIKTTKHIKTLLKQNQIDKAKALIPCLEELTTLKLPESNHNEVQELLNFMCNKRKQA